MIEDKTKAASEGEVWPVMLTPFNEDNTIDFKSLDELTDFYIATGSTGLFANCLSSEMFHLTDSERLKITEAVVKRTGGRQPVVATGNFSDKLSRSVDFIKKIYDTGVQAVIINSSMLAGEKESDDALRKNMETIMDATGNIPFGIYECPVPYKRIVPVDVMRWMAESGRFIFLKSTSCDLDEIKSKLAVTEGTRLKINNANIPTALGSLQAGAHGIASIASNFYPELIASLANYRAITSASLDKLNTWLTIVDVLIHQLYPMSAKYFLRKRGMNIRLNCRVPTGSFAYQDYVKFDALHRAFEAITDELDISIAKF